MKTRLCAVFALSSLAALLALLAMLSGAQLAQAALPAVASLEPNQQGPSTTEYLMPLPLPAAETLDVPLGMTREQAVEYARSLSYRQAQPVLAELERLRVTGQIAGFEVRPDLHAVAVQLVPGTDASSTLGRLSIHGFVAMADKQAPACVTGAADALIDQVLGLSRKPFSNGARRVAGGLSVQATNPSIDAYVLPGSTWTYVTGSTTPATTVSLRILRGGRVIATGTTTSSSTGYYYFYPAYQSCPSGGYSWTLTPNDVVEVTAGGSTVSMTIVNISAWVDPEADVVAGTTAAGRSVEVRLYHAPTDFCSSTMYTETVSAGGGGAFSASFAAQVNFNRRASANIYARDANGNSTFSWSNAYRISAYFDSSSFWGYFKPDVGFTATLSRTGSIIATYNGASNAYGYYYGYFGYVIQSGDVISVSGGGVSMQYTATSLTNLTLNPATNQATGTTGAGRRAWAYFYKNASSWPLPTKCSSSSSCVSAVADGSGNFTLSAGIDLAPGDYAYFGVDDAEGNYQYYSSRFNIPAIAAQLSWNEVVGYWRTPYVYVTVILKDSSDVVKGTRTAWVGGSDGSFYAYPGTILPTDKIEVGDGVVTETMTVQNLTARLDGGSGHLTGSAPNTRLLAQLWDFRRDLNFYWYFNCSETTVAGGTFDLTFGGAQPGAQDAAYVFSTGPDGHYTARYASTFSVNAQKGDDYVWGYSETPSTPVTVTLRAGATTKAVYTTTSFGYGYFYAYLSSGTLVTITQGDTLQVQTGDGDNATLTISELTVNKDAANNRLYGRSPASEPVQPALRRRSSPYGYYYYSSSTTADASGNYSASFNGLYYSLDCSAVQVGHQCAWPAVTYYNAAGHSVWLEAAQPQPVSADIYESDDTSATARPYAGGLQHHTFHAVTDTDWITFTVTAADVANNVTFHVEMLNLGFGMYAYVYLIDTDGSSVLASSYGSSRYPARIDWIPSTAGTYYVQARPYSSSYAAYCDAVYDLMVLPVRARVYLPAVMRNYP
jgi:hypothetical protein